MHILFLTHYFPPEVNAPASRTYENAKRWARAGHKVTVITCAPNHPNGIVYPGTERVQRGTLLRCCISSEAPGGRVNRTVKGDGPEIMIFSGIEADGTEIMTFSGMAARPGADQRLGAQALQLLGRPHPPAHGRGAGPGEMLFEFHRVNAADHAGLPERDPRRRRPAPGRLYQRNCAGAE